MKTWNLTGGAARLEMAFKSLKKTASEANDSWSDQASRRFQETYLTALEPKVRDALDAIRHLEQILAGAEHECGSP